jgi:hypothetical protein
VTRLQRKALCNLGLAGVCLLLQLLRFAVSDAPIQLFASTLTLVLGCILLASYFHRRKLVKLGGSEYDERDRSIHTMACLIGLMVQFLMSFSATLIAFVIVGPGGKIEIGAVLGMFLSAAMGFFFAESAAVLVQYGRGGNDNE